MLKTKSLALLTWGLGLLAIPSIAGPPTTGGLTGSFTGTGWATVSFTNLNFCPNGQSPNGPNQANACQPGIGNIALAGGSGTFAGVTGNLNTIQSLDSTHEPVGVMVSLTNWLTFNPPVTAGHGPMSLTLTEVFPGSFTSAQCGLAPAAGQICTPPGSAFNLVNFSDTTSSVSFEVTGNAVDSKTGDTTPFVGIFSSQFTVPYQTLLAALAVNGGTGNYSSSYSATFSLVHQVAEGRMTGGGSFFIGGTRVTHGLELHCDISDVPNNLEVNWNGNHFHLNQLTSASCFLLDTPPNPPAAPINTLIGAGTGSYNNVPGASITFTLTDHGEPGTQDTVTISITDANGNVVLSGGPVFLTFGNQQAHFDNK
jgi:hypothetical protein